MHVLTKIGDEVLLVYHPRERVEVGENLKVIEEEENRGLLVQVIEKNLVDRSSSLLCGKITRM